MTIPGGDRVFIIAEAGVNHNESNESAGNKKISLTINAAQGNLDVLDLNHIFAPRWISPWASGGVIYFQERCHVS